MKRKIRRTGEIIDVITFSSSTTRSDHDRIQFYGDTRCGVMVYNYSR